MNQQTKDFLADNKISPITLVTALKLARAQTVTAYPGLDSRFFITLNGIVYPNKMLRPLLVTLMHLDGVKAVIQLKDEKTWELNFNDGSKYVLFNLFKRAKAGQLEQYTQELRKNKCRHWSTLIYLDAIAEEELARDFKRFEDVVLKRKMTSAEKRPRWSQKKRSAKDAFLRASSSETENV